MRCVGHELLLRLEQHLQPDDHFVEACGEGADLRRPRRPERAPTSHLGPRLRRLLELRQRRRDRAREPQANDSRHSENDPRDGCEHEPVPTYATVEGGVGYVTRTAPCTLPLEATGTATYMRFLPSVLEWRVPAVV